MAPKVANAGHGRAIEGMHWQAPTHGLAWPGLRATAGMAGLGLASTHMHGPPQAQLAMLPAQAACRGGQLGPHWAMRLAHGCHPVLPRAPKASQVPCKCIGACAVAWGQVRPHTGMQHGGVGLHMQAHAGMPGQVIASTKPGHASCTCHHMLACAPPWPRLPTHATTCFYFFQVFVQA